MDSNFLSFDNYNDVSLHKTSVTGTQTGVLTNHTSSYVTSADGIKTGRTSVLVY